MPYAYAYAVLHGGTNAVLIPVAGNTAILPSRCRWRSIASIDFISPVIGCCCLSIDAVLPATKHPNRNRTDRLAFVDILKADAGSYRADSGEGISGLTGQTMREIAPIGHSICINSAFIDRDEIRLELFEDCKDKSHVIYGIVRVIRRCAAGRAGVP